MWLLVQVQAECRVPYMATHARTIKTCEKTDIRNKMQCSNCLRHAGSGGNTQGDCASHEVSFALRLVATRPRLSGVNSDGATCMLRRGGGRYGTAGPARGPTIHGSLWFCVKPCSKHQRQLTPSLFGHTSQVQSKESGPTSLRPMSASRAAGAGPPRHTQSSTVCASGAACSVRFPTSHSMPVSSAPKPRTASRAVEVQPALGPHAPARMPHEQEWAVGLLARGGGGGEWATSVGTLAGKPMWASTPVGSLALTPMGRASRGVCAPRSFSRK